MQSSVLIEFRSLEVIDMANAAELTEQFATLRERVDGNIKFFWKVIAFGFVWLGAITYLLVQTKQAVDQLPLQISANLVRKAKREATSGRLQQAVTAIQTASAMLQSAQDQNLRPNPKFFERQVEELSSISQTPTLLSTANEFRFVLATYRSHLNPTPPIPKKQSEFKSPSDINLGTTYPIYGTVNLGKNTHLSASIPLEVALDGSVQKPKSQNIITVPSHSLEDNNVTVDGIILIGATQTLSGIEWENVIFVNMHIIYDSGSIKLKNVRFVNCTFDLPNNQDGKRLADYAALNQAEDFRIG
jgi:hypothetical protein